MLLKDKTIQPFYNFSICSSLLEIPDLSPNLVNLLRCFILHDHFAYTGCLCIAYGRWNSWRSYYCEGHSCRNGDIFSSTGNCLLHMKILNIIWLLKNSMKIIVFVRSITEMLFQTLNYYSQWFLSFHILSVI